MEPMILAAWGSGPGWTRAAFPRPLLFAQRIEKMGYGALWLPEAVGRDPFVTITHLAGATSRLYLATGIANIYARDAMAMAAIRNSLNELSGGRLVLRLGVSHENLVSGLRRHQYKTDHHHAGLPGGDATVLLRGA